MPTAFISGANRGLGLALSERFVSDGWRVIAACRTPHDARDLNALVDKADGRVDTVAYDASDPGAPARVASALGDQAIDVLFNNAGISGGWGDAQTLGSLDRPGMEQVLAINVCGPLTLSEALVDHVARSDRKIIVTQSSQMGSIDDNTSGGAYAYRASKAALNMVTKSMAVDLAPRGITVAALHPGWVQTDMGGESAPLTPAESADGQFRVVTGLTQADTGGFFNQNGERLAW